MPQQPKPAKGGAEMHRDEERDEEDDLVEAAVEGAATGAGAGGERDGGGGGGGDGAPPAAPGSGSVLTSPAMKRLAFVMALALAAYLVYRWAQNRSGGGFDIEDETGDDRVGPGGIPVDENGIPQIPRDDDDPLVADEAIGRVLGFWGDED